MRIVIDPGHGGTDSGAVGYSGMYEKDLALVVSLMLAGYLHPPIVPILTRNTDEFIELGKRVAIADSVKADLFISVHFNSYKHPSAHGTEVFHFPERERSQAFAEAIIEPFVLGTGLRNRGVKSARFRVLTTQAPAILVEPCFITNPNEEVFVRNPKWLCDVVYGLAAGIYNYIDSKGGHVKC